MTLIVIVMMVPLYDGNLCIFCVSHFPYFEQTLHFPREKKKQTP